MLTFLLSLCRYLDYIEEKKDIGMIIRLYERCLVACASYPGTLLLFAPIFSHESSLCPQLLPTAHAQRLRNLLKYTIVDVSQYCHTLCILICQRWLHVLCCYALPIRCIPSVLSADTQLTTALQAISICQLT